MKTISRRKFAAFLASVPFVGSLFAKADEQLIDEAWQNREVFFFEAETHYGRAIGLGVRGQHWHGDSAGRQAIVIRDGQTVREAVAKLRALADSIENRRELVPVDQNLNGRFLHAEDHPYLEGSEGGNLRFAKLDSMTFNQFTVLPIYGEIPEMRSNTVDVFNKARTKKFRVLKELFGRSFIGTESEVEKWVEEMKMARQCLQES